MIKRLILAGLGALAVVTTMGSANAADMQRRNAMSAKAPVYEVPYSWTGFYVGINGGGGFGHSNWSNVIGTNGFDLSGAVVGGTIGYNYQMSQAVFGLEGDGDWSNIRGSTTGGACIGATCETKNSCLATARPYRLCLRPLHALRHRRRGLWRHQGDGGRNRQPDHHARRLDRRRRS